MIQPSVLETILETKGLVIGFKRKGRTTRILAKDINVALRPYEFTCLLGPNGAGKSTLIRTLAGMQEAISGSVFVLGDPLDRLSARELAKRMSLVITQPVLVGMMPVLTFVALGRYPYTNWLGKLRSEDKDAVWRAIDYVGIKDLVYRPMCELSDGERQKVKIARALAQETQIIILDEATAFLDMPHRVELMALLKRLSHEGGKAVLLSTHDLDLALRWADRLWLLPSGGPLLHGVPEDLILDDTFSSTFSNDGIVFDKRFGSFAAPGRQRGVVALEGEGLPLIWTQRALERAGYTVSNDGEIVISVRPEENNGRPVWYLLGVQKRSCDSIEKLLAALDECFK